MSEIIPWDTDIESDPVRLFPEEYALREYADLHRRSKRRLGIVVVKLYWQAPEQDHLKAYFDSKEQIGWDEIIAYGQEELATWVAGIALSEERAQVLRLSNRENGSFAKKYGWRPAVFTMWKPTEPENEQYVRYQNSILDDEWEEFEL